jgi:tripartite-type tricarboxylate transporter receptor subunit TctC
MILNRMLRAFVAALLTMLAAPALAQNFPTRPITFVLGFPPGASTDSFARLIKEPMEKELGQPIIIENRGGAGGTTGAAVVANAAPDGYTLMVTVNAPVTMNKWMQKNFPFDPLTKLIPVGIVGETVMVLAVNPKVLDVHTVAELIDYAKKNPGKLSFGSAGVGSGHHIAGALLNKNAGIDMIHVPYKGGGPAIQDLVAGQIPISFGTAAAILPQAQSGTIRMIALAEAKRSPIIPDLPTISETVPGVVSNTWLGMFAPAGTPKPIIDKLNKALNKAVADPTVVEKMKKLGFTLMPSTPEDAAKLVHDEYESWGKIIPSIGIEPE